MQSRGTQRRTRFTVFIGVLSALAFGALYSMISGGGIQGAANTAATVQTVTTRSAASTSDDGYAEIENGDNEEESAPAPTPATSTVHTRTRAS